MMVSRSITILSFLWVSVLGIAQADVLTLQDGRTMSGIVEEAGENSPTVKFIGASGSITIPRERVRSIEREPKARGYMHIGDSFTRQGNLESALGAYRQAIGADPDSADARERIQTTQAALDRRTRLDRQDDIGEIERLMIDIRAHIRRGEFDTAEEVVQRASKLVPAPDQRKTLRDLIGNLYLTWARERLDKLDRPGTEQKLDLALAAQPQNQEVIAMLLQVWEGQTAKKPQLLGLYKTVLEQRPQDQTLRRRVADLSYELGDLDEAIYHYLTIYEASPEEFKGKPLEERIVDNLDRLHRTYAIKKDYDQAIYLYRVLLSIDPGADPSGLNYYEYLKRAEKVTAGDVEGQIALAQFIEKSGLPQTMALELYRKVLALVPDNEIAKAAIDGYAMSLIQEAQLNFARSQFYLAKTLSNQVLRDFPDSAMAGEKALEIRGASDIEIARDEKSSRDRAKQVVDQGNLYNQQAMVFYRDIFDTQRSNQSPYASPKSDAMKYFTLAVQAYEAAIRLDASVVNDPALNVGANLQLARNYIRFLSSPAPSVGLYARNRPMR